VESPLTARTAVLQALDHPAHGLELIRRVETRTGGRVRLRQGSVYPALRRLETEGRVRSWTRTASRSGGRPRLYYELTLKGVRAASDLRAAVAGLLQGPLPPPPSPSEAEAMRDRLRRCAEVSAFCMRLRRAVLQASKTVTAGEPHLTQVAARLMEVFGPDDCVIVGALAVAVHGYPRAADRVDLLTRLDLRKARKTLRAGGIETVYKRHAMTWLKGTLDGVGFRVQPEVVPLRWDRAVHVPSEGNTLGVIDLDGLLRLKLRAGGPQDLMDAAHLLLQHPEHIAQACADALAFGIADDLEMWLGDPRTRLSAEEELTTASGTAGPRETAPAPAPPMSARPRRRRGRKASARRSSTRSHPRAGSR
jgi:DNA-binding PadR family transcriptional regulator